jgi:Ca2+/H+ antiporter
MNAQHLGGVVMGALVLLVGLAWVLGAIRRVRERALTAPTYAATGGVVYTVFQIGCAGVLIVAGLVILILMVISASR